MKQIRSLKRQGGWWQIAAAGISVASSLFGGGKAKKQAGRLAAENIKMIELETAEELRRMELTQEQVMGEAHARAAASGFEVNRKFGGDTDYQNYFDELDEEYKARVAWTNKAAAQQKRVVAQGGVNVKSQIGAASTAASIGAITDLIKTF